MQTKHKTLLALTALGSICLLGPTVTLYNKWRDDVFFEGYQRGVCHGGLYIFQKGLPAPLAWQSNAWRYVNMEPSWSVDAVRP